MPKPVRHVLVCLNARPGDDPRGSCSQRGGQDLFARLKTLVAERLPAGQVMVTRTGCLKHCSRGPVIVIHPDNVWYARVRVDDLDEIVESHLIGGRPVARLLMPDVPWE